MTEIPVSDFTQTTLEGTGVYDVLMRANRTHLENEFTKNRITGPEYSKVYLGSLQIVMQTSLEFLLQRQKVALEAQLLEKQILLQDKALAKADAEIALLIQQKINATTQNDNLIKEGCKLAAEFDVLMAQSLKVGAETQLLNQKTVTERGQTTSQGVEENSVIGRQKLLYQAQTEGFKRSAEKDVAKLLVDSWAVRRTTDEGTVADGNNKLDDGTIGRAVNKMLSGVGA